MVEQASVERVRKHLVTVKYPDGESEPFIILKTPRFRLTFNAFLLGDPLNSISDENARVIKAEELVVMMVSTSLFMNQGGWSGPRAYSKKDFNQLLMHPINQAAMVTQMAELLTPEEKR